MSAAGSRLASALLLTRLCRQVRTNSLIVATGALAKRLGIPNEEVFWSSGISACAICDGASHIFRNKARPLGGPAFIRLL